MPQAPLRTTIASTTICLFGSLLLGPTIAMAEYNVSAALQAYDSADSTNRKTWELIFGNTANGINWANTVLFFRKQEPLYCPPDDFALTGPPVIEMLRELATSNPNLRRCRMALLFYWHFKANTRAANNLQRLG